MFYGPRHSNLPFSYLSPILGSMLKLQSTTRLSEFLHPAWRTQNPWFRVWDFKNFKAFRKPSSAAYF